jgi:uncharacterized membrane protein YhaH (DUF805 family)
MSFSDAIRTCFQKYATFSGRASRPEYWYFILFLLLASLVLGAVDGMLFGNDVVSATPFSFMISADGPLGSLFNLVTVIPALAVGWRRMHDTGRSGLFLLYPLIVIVGIGTFTAFFHLLPWQLEGVLMLAMMGAMLILFISPLLVLWWLSRPSQPGANDWGPAPQVAP